MSYIFLKTPYESFSLTHFLSFEDVHQIRESLSAERSLYSLPVITVLLISKKNPLETIKQDWKQLN